MARLEQRTDDLATDVRTLAPLVIAMAEVKLTVSQVQQKQGEVFRALEEINRHLDQDVKGIYQQLDRDVKGIYQRLDQDKDARAKEREKRTEAERERRTEERRDSRNFRRTLIGIGIAAVLSPIGTLVIVLITGRS